MTDIDWSAIADELYEKYGIDHLSIERKFGEAVAIHYITMPRAMANDYYRSVLSLEGFASRERKQTFKKGQPISPHCINVRPRHFTMQRRDDWEFRETSVRESFAKRGMPFTRTYGDVPTFEHASIWDFYKAIGYDYKKKRYLPVA